MKLVNVQIIKDELERLIRNYGFIHDYMFHSSAEAKYRCEAYKELSEWLDGLDVKDDMDTIHPIEDVVSNDPIANSYKEKYEQALKVAKETYNTQPMYREWLEKMFPELSESEDEKVRKALIRFHKSTIDIDGIKGADIISWLEKQGEQKPTDEDMKTLLRTEYEKGRADAIADMHWLKSLRPQNRWKPSERHLACLQDAIEHYHLMGSPATTLTEILKQLRKLKDGKV